MRRPPTKANQNWTDACFEEWCGTCNCTMLGKNLGKTGGVQSDITVQTPPQTTDARTQRSKDRTASVPRDPKAYPRPHIQADTRCAPQSSIAVPASRRCQPWATHLCTKPACRTATKKSTCALSSREDPRTRQGESRKTKNRSKTWWVRKRRALRPGTPQCPGAAKLRKPRMLRQCLAGASCGDARASSRMRANSNTEQSLPNKTDCLHACPLAISSIRVSRRGGPENG